MNSFDYLKSTLGLEDSARAKQVKSKTSVQMPTWWEKTVEWQFVLLASNQKGLKFAPLGGDRESAESDASLSSGKKFALVEFKRESQDCHAFSEFKKYARQIKEPSSEQAEEMFNKACRELIKLDGHKSHLFVYGKRFSTADAMDELLGSDSKILEEPEAGQLILEASSYWTNKASIEPAVLAVKNCLVDKQEYDVYVKRLAELRGYSQKTKSGGAVVLGFEKNNLTVMDVMEYVRAIRPAPSNKPAAKKDSARNTKPGGSFGIGRN